MLVAPRVDELPPLAQRCIAAQLSTEASRAESKSTRLVLRDGAVGSMHRPIHPRSLVACGRTGGIAAARAHEAAS